MRSAPLVEEVLVDHFHRVDGLPGGFVAVFARPVRERGAVWLATSHLAEILTDARVRLEAHVVAVDVAATEDWHLLLARVPAGA